MLARERWLSLTPVSWVVESGQREEGTGPTYDAATKISFLRVILLWLGLQWGIISVLMGYSNYPFK